MKQRILGFLLLCGLVLSGCSLGPREDWAESMRKADVAARKQSGAHVHVSVTMKPIETNIRVVPAPLFKTLDGTIDFKTKASKLKAKSATNTKGATVFFDDLVAVFPRSADAIATSEGSKHWSTYDFTRKLKEEDEPDANDRLISLGYAMSPSLAVDLLEGVLAGSAKDLGAETVGGAQTTKYYIRLAPDAATRKLRNQRRVDGIELMLETIGVRQDIFPIYVWMDSEGIARRIQLVLEQQYDVVNRFRTTVQYDFSKFGPVPAVQLPAKADTVRRSRFLDFVTDYIRASA